MGSSKAEIPGWVPEFADEFDDDDESEEGSKGDTANSHGAFNFDDADDVDKVPETELDDPLEQNKNPSEDPIEYINHWTELDGLNKFVIETWKLPASFPVETNAMKECDAKTISIDQQTEIKKGAVTIEEVKKAVWVLRFPTQSPGPDGFSLAFIENFGHVLKMMFCGG
ncbi:hypothetical protein Tco_0011176 [Tanacetum coccineum]